uniref:Uncharacterized protein n=1 Tax=viral metagenome TaxID=1070528 RepID=A0A6M3M2S6_9ZZZZ
MPGGAHGAEGSGDVAFHGSAAREGGGLPAMKIMVDRGDLEYIQSLLELGNVEEARDALNEILENA